MMPNFLKLSCLAICFFISGCITFTDYYVKPDASYEILPTGQEGVSFDIKYKKIIIDLYVRGYSRSITAELKIRNLSRNEIVFKGYETQLISQSNNRIQYPSHVWKRESFSIENQSSYLLDEESLVIINPQQEQLFLLNLGSEEFHFNFLNKKSETHLIVFKFIDSNDREFFIKSEIVSIIR